MRGSLTATFLYFLGMLAVLVGERAIGAGSARWVTLLGVLLVLGAAVQRLWRWRSATGERRRIERDLAVLAALGLAALALYFIQSDLWPRLAGAPLEKRWPRLAGSLGALWPALWLASALPLVMVELAYAAVARAPRLEAGRLRDALLTGLGLAGALVFAFAITYVATEHDHKVDLSYFRTARPGEATRKIVRTLDQPIDVSLFFPPASEVRDETSGYFADLAKESGQIRVGNYDHAVDPSKAKELGVSGNGMVVIGRGTRREQLSVGIELESARSRLQNLDKEVQKRILQVARPARVVYLITGHGERGPEALGETDKRATVRELRDALVQQGYTVRNLGAAEGLVTDVPADAAAVLLLGPTKALLSEETKALERYLGRGGRVLLALDVEAGQELRELLAPFGLRFLPTLLANDQVYAKRSYQTGDRANLVSGWFSSHPSVTTLGRLGMRLPMVLPSAGAFEEIKGHDKETSVSFTVHAHGSTWNDLDGNFTFDAPPKGGQAGQPSDSQKLVEERKAWELAAAVTRKPAGAKQAAAEARLVALADVDALADGVFGNPGNAYFLIDSLKWLLGDEAIAGEISSETDVPIAHTKRRDVAWFYGSIFLAPALAIGVGLLVTRRRRAGKARRGAKEAA